MLFAALRKRRLFKSRLWRSKPILKERKEGDGDSFKGWKNDGSAMTNDVLLGMKMRYVPMYKASTHS